MSNVIRNVWDKVTIYCVNHDTPAEMKLFSNTKQIKTPYMACQHEHPCPNRLNMDDYQGLCLKLMKKMDEDPLANLKNSRFEYRGSRQKLAVRVLKDTDDEISLPSSTVSCGLSSGFGSLMNLNARQLSLSMTNSLPSSTNSSSASISFA